MTDNPSDVGNGLDSTRNENRNEMGHPQGVDAVVLDLNEVFKALGHPRRRYLLYTLVNGSNEKTLSELAATIVAWEQEKPEEEVTDGERTEVQLSLYHSHVPKLADLGVLDYKQGEETIVRARNTEQVQTVLDGAGAELDARQENHARGNDI